MQLNSNFLILLYITYLVRDNKIAIGGFINLPHLTKPNASNNKTVNLASAVPKIFYSENT